MRNSKTVPETQAVRETSNKWQDNIYGAYGVDLFHCGKQVKLLSSLVYANCETDTTSLTRFAETTFDSSLLSQATPLIVPNLPADPIGTPCFITSSNAYKFSKIRAGRYFLGL